MSTRNGLEGNASPTPWKAGRDHRNQHLLTAPQPCHFVFDADILHALLGITLSSYLFSCIYLTFLGVLHMFIVIQNVRSDVEKHVPWTFLKRQAQMRKPVITLWYESNNRTIGKQMSCELWTRTVSCFSAGRNSSILGSSLGTGSSRNHECWVS